ncbi:hypothetical protein HanPSC8_Chr17g0756411 [Helianthus annuus]|nr:hypothetical protein HanPSC8_Chr17g0756411 [Helianthus annuus]
MSNINENQFNTKKKKNQGKTNLGGVAVGWKRGRRKGGGRRQEREAEGGGRRRRGRLKAAVVGRRGVVRWKRGRMRAVGGVRW